MSDMVAVKKTTPMRPERKCPVCGTMFRPNKANQAFSTSKCRKANWSDKNPAGMTLRQWFAGMALPGILQTRAKCSADITQQSIVEEAFELADAMIAYEKGTK